MWECSSPLLHARLLMPSLPRAHAHTYDKHAHPSSPLLFFFSLLLLLLSLDAKSKSISVMTKGGGLKLLQIQDDGTGIAVRWSFSKKTLVFIIKIFSPPPRRKKKAACCVLLGTLWLVAYSPYPILRCQTLASVAHPTAAPVARNCCLLHLFACWYIAAHQARWLWNCMWTFHDKQTAIFWRSQQHQHVRIPRRGSGQHQPRCTRHHHFTDRGHAVCLPSSLQWQLVRFFIKKMYKSLSVFLLCTFIFHGLVLI